MYKPHHVFAVLSLVLFINPIKPAQKLDVEVLYESLCPDSLDFIVNQLHPVWKELAPYVNLKLTPFGKSVHVGNSEFICQHGPLECKGNRIMSCALSLIPNQDAQVEYVNCFMKIFKKGKNNENEFGQICAQSVGLGFDKMTACYESSRGTELQLLAEKDTFKFSPSFVPTIVYLDQFSQQLQDASLQDFRGVVCEIISQSHPEACKSQHILRL